MLLSSKADWMDCDSFSPTLKSTVMFAATWWATSGYQKSSCGDALGVSLTQHEFIV